MDQNQDCSSALLYIENMIIPNGHTYEEFLEHLKTKKTNALGNDLCLWNMDELIEEGNDFLSNAHTRELAKKPSVAEPPQVQGQYQYPPEEQVLQHNKFAINKVYGGKLFQINPNGFLSKNTNLTAKIESYDEQPGSLFSKSYISYKIVLTPLGYIINRRYSDFDRLREYLCKNYPEYIIPPIPAKVSQSKKPEVVQYRLVALERFLNLIIKGFWFDPYVDVFFSGQKEDEINKVVKGLPGRICDCKSATTLTGQIECQISTQIDSFFANQGGLLDKQSEIYNSIKKRCRKIVDATTNLSQEYKEMGLCFQQLLNMIRVHNEMQIEKINESPVKGVYDLFMDWQERQQQIAELFTKNMIYFCKYQNSVFDAIKEKIKYRDQMKENFIKQYSKLESKKERFFKEQNVASWEIPKGQLTPKIQQDEKLAKSLMLPQETKLVEYLQDNYGFVNKTLYQQIQLAINYSLGQIDQQMQSILLQVKLATYQLYDNYLNRKS